MADALTLNVGTFLALSILALASMLFAVSILSYWRVRHPRLLFVSLAFGALAAKGLYSAYVALATGAVELVVGVLDFAVLAFLYLSIAKR